MNRFCSMFSQILKLIPRLDFERMVKQTKSEYASKGLSSWSQFVAMMFCQLGRAHEACTQMGATGLLADVERELERVGSGTGLAGPAPESS